ncbi:hypothetical protein HDU89_007802 [Geranomyces variabilis]|nr:hypothetical protein HDU89_007802 [Geranomyces variabilis]
MSGTAPSTTFRGLNHVTEDPTPLPLDSLEYAANYHKASHWDEGISMNVTAERPVVINSDFTWFGMRTAIYLLAHNAQPSNDETWKRDFLAFVEQRKSEGDERAIKLDYDDKGRSFRQLSAAALTGMGFTKANTSKPFIIRPFAAGMSDPVVATLDREFEILPTVPRDALWQKRIDLECTFFPYSAQHTARLDPALTYMAEIGCDKHHVIVERATGKVMTYVTMRYARGVAYLQGAGTAAEFRRRGLVRVLLGKATEEAVAMGYPGMATSAWDERAQKTWHALGFTVRGNSHTEWIRPGGGVV